MLVVYTSTSSFLPAPPAGGTFSPFLLLTQPLFTGSCQGRRSLSVINGCKLRRTITRRRKKVSRKIYKIKVMDVVVVNDLEVQKHPPDVLSKGVHGALRQNYLSRAPIATLKSATALFERSKSTLHIQPKFLKHHLFSPSFHRLKQIALRNLQPS